MIPAIRFKIITMFPIKVNFKVKNTKHHKIFRKPLTSIKIIIFFGMLVFLIHKELIIANVI
jgi:hypothetical protein